MLKQVQDCRAAIAALANGDEWVSLNALVAAPAMSAFVASGVLDSIATIYGVPAGNDVMIAA